MTGAALAAWAVEALIASTLLMVLVLLLRVPVRRAFGPQVAYALWALPVLRLILPPLPAGLRQAAATPLSRASETITVFVVDPTAAAPTPAAAVSATDLVVSLLPAIAATLALLWAIGAAGFLVWHMTRHARFCRRMLTSAAAVEHLRGVRVIASPAAPGPLAFGVMRRYVAFPLDFSDRYDDDERALALEHEIGHHQRGDLVANWIALAVLALHWFNPVAWRAFRAFRADQELANDARVLAGRSAIDRHTYACAILKAAHGGAVSAACHLHTIDDLKGRLRMLTTSPRSRRRLAAGGTLVATLMVTGLGLTASGTSAAKAISTKVGAAVGVDLQAAPPAPPAAPAAAAPAAPAVPPAPAKAKRTRVTIVKNGRATTYEGAAADAYLDRDPRPLPPPPPALAMNQGPTVVAPPAPPMPPMPLIESRNCSTGGNGRTSYTEQRRDGRVTVICVNRIQAAARKAAISAVDAQRIKTSAMATAMQSLNATRASLAANVDMSAKDRQEAVAEIDDAIREMQAEMRSAD